jgi:hypothetical protein
MRFMVLVKSDATTESGALPDEASLAEMGAFNEELARAGAMLGGEGLHPSSRGVRLHFAGGETRVTPGPFPDPGQLVAGFWILEAGSQDEVIEWLRRSPFANLVGVEAEVEIRQIMEADDFGEAFTPELREQEDRIRAKIAGEE